MATAARVDTLIEINGVKAVKSVWTITGTDEGDPFMDVGYADRSVQFVGTFGNAVAMQGSNDGTNYFTLKDLQGTDISTSTNKTLKGIAELPLYIKPVPAGAVTSVVVTMISRRP